MTRRKPTRRRMVIGERAYWLHRSGTITDAEGTFLGSIEKAPARGQRISRQPWKAYAVDMYAGVYRSQREAVTELVKRAAA